MGTDDKKQDKSPSLGKVLTSVMASFFEAAQAGRFPDLNDQDGIWRLLSQMTRRKVIDHVRRNHLDRHVAAAQGIGGDQRLADPGFVAAADEAETE